MEQENLERICRECENPIPKDKTMYGRKDKAYCRDCFAEKLGSAVEEYPFFDPTEDTEYK